MLSFAHQCHHVTKSVTSAEKGLYTIDHFHNDVKQSLKARRNIEYEKGDLPNSVCIGNCFEAEIRIQI